MKVHVKKAFWAFDVKKGQWFKSDCYAKVVKDKYGIWAKTPTGLIRVK